MKKIIFSLILFVFSILNVWADDLLEGQKQMINYVVELNRKKYSVAVTYSKDSSKVNNTDTDVYIIDSNADVMLVDENGKKIDIIKDFRTMQFPDLTVTMAFDLPRIANIPAYIFESENYSELMEDLLPKFALINDEIYFYTYTTNEDFLNLYFKDYCENDECDKWGNFSWENDWKTIYEYGDIDIADGSADGPPIVSSFDRVINDDVVVGDNTYSGTESYTINTFIKLAKELNALLDEANKVSVCTNDDIKSLKSQRNLLFMNLRDDFDASLSSNCYSLLFGNNNIYDKTIIVRGIVSNYMDSEFNDTMSFLYLESSYLRSLAFINGEGVQVEVTEVVRCGMFGEKTVSFLQEIFDVLKFAGIIIGTLLIIVDVFKAIVGKEDAMKKSLKVMMKRIVAIAVLILLPFLVEIIFELVNSIGVTDPICGIK